MKNIKVLINEEKLNKRIEELAKQIEKDYFGKEIVFLGILKGSIPFMTDLSKKINNIMTFEYIEVSSYENNESTGNIKLNKDISKSIEGKDVIIIEDIVDTGRTLKYLEEHLKTKNPKSLKIAALLNKQSRRITDIKADYIGFEINDVFVLGYGLDYDQKYRNLPYIGFMD